MKKKMMALVLCVALVAVAAVGATMAYFTDTQEVNNTFTVGNVRITLDETTVNELGEKTSDVRTTKGNAYKLIPGHTYVKDPTVTVVKGSEECYVRALITINNKAALDEIFAPNGVDLSTVLTGASADWTYEGYEVVGDARVYTLWYKATVKAVDSDVKLPALFKNLVIPQEMTNKDLASLKNFEIKVEANAIQADGFKDAADAWEHFQ